MALRGLLDLNSTIKIHVHVTCLPRYHVDAGVVKEGANSEDGSKILMIGLYFIPNLTTVCSAMSIFWLVNSTGSRCM